MAFLGVAWLDTARVGTELVTVLFCLLKLLMGVGFTFYSGAIDAWLVDALREVRHEGYILDQIFARGAALSRLLGLLSTLAGAGMAQIGLGFPFAVRAALLGCTFVAAAQMMHDIGFTPTPLTTQLYWKKLVGIVRTSISYGWSNLAVRMIMLASFTQAILTTWGFYAWQSYFLVLYGDVHAVWLIGVISALVACARSLGNLLLDALITSGLVKYRTTIMLCAIPTLLATSIALAGSSSITQAVLWLMCLMATMGVANPVRQAFLHREIPSTQRATVVSFQQIFIGGGSVLGQLVLGYSADITSIPVAYAIGGCLSLFSLPSILLLRSLRRDGDSFVVQRSHHA